MRIQGNQCMECTMAEVAFVRCSVESLLTSCVAGDCAARNCARRTLYAMRYRDGRNYLERMDGSGDLVTMDIMTAARFDMQGDCGGDFKCFGA